MMSYSFAGLLLMWSSFYAGFVVVTFVRAARRARQSKTKPPAGIDPWPELLCLCPMSAGDAPQRVTFALPMYRGRLRFVFLCAANDLTAQLRAARRLSTLERQRIAGHIVVTTPRGRNPKSSQLAQVPAELLAGHDMVLVLDGDVEIGSVNATELVRRLRTEAKLGAVWQPSVPAPLQKTPGDRAAAAILLASPYAMPFAGLFRPQMAAGKVLLLKTRALDCIGGFGGSAHVLGEDVHISDCLLAMGFGVDALAGRPAISIRTGQSARAVWQRMVRWHRIIIEQAPRLLWAYPLYVFYWPLQMLAWMAAIGHESPAVIFGGVVVATLLRTALARRIGQLGFRAQTFLQSARAGLLSDVWLVTTFVRALLRAHVFWHGRSIRSSARHPTPPRTTVRTRGGQAA